MFQVSKAILNDIDRALGKGRWRLDYVGNMIIRPQPEQECYTASPLLSVYFSRLDEPNENNIFSNQALLRDGNAFIHKRVDISVGCLPALIAGSVWENGRPDFKSPQLHRPRRIALNMPAFLPSFESLPITSLPDARGFKTISSYYPLREECINCIELHSQSVASKYAGVIIPVSEIHRFYYGYSTRLVDAVFSSDIEINMNKYYSSLKSHHYMEKKRKGFSLHLRHIMADDEADLFLRIAPEKELDKSIAYKNAVRISQQIIRCLSQQKNATEEIPLFSSFPFSGGTVLRVRGKQIKGPRNKWYFLILQIISCSGKFPFDIYKIERDNDNRQGVSSTSTEKEGDAYPTKYPRQRPDAVKIVSTGANPEEESIELIIDTPTPRHTYLKGRRRRQKIKITQSYKSGGSTSIETDAKIQASPGKSGTNNPVVIRPSEEEADFIANDKNIPMHFKYIEETLKILNSENNAAVNIYNCQKNIFAPLTDSYWTYFPPKNDEGRLSWSFINGLSRRAVLAEINYENRGYFYILETEKKDLNNRYCLIIFHTEQTTPISNSEIYHIMRELASTKMLGYKKTLKEDLALEHKLYNHTYSQKEGADPRAYQTAKKIQQYCSSSVEPVKAVTRTR